MRKNRLKRTIALVVAVFLTACEKNTLLYPYGSDTKTVLSNELGFPPSGAIPASNLGTLTQLNYAAEACAEATRGTGNITVQGATPAPNQVSPKISLNGANCPAIYQDFFEQAASLSDLACDTFLDRLYAKQQDLSAASDTTNIVGGVVSAATAIFTLGSVVGGVTGLTVSALNEAFDSYSSIFLFSIPAGDIRTLVYTQKQVVRESVRQNGIQSLYVSKIAIRDYFLACTPASLKQYVTKAIQDKAANPFLSDRLQTDAARKNALAIIVEAAREIGPYLGADSDASAVVSPQGIAALYFELGVNQSDLSDSPVDTKMKVDDYLKKQKLYDASTGQFMYNTKRVTDEANKLVLAAHAEVPSRALSLADASSLVRDRFQALVMRPLILIGATNGPAALAMMKDLLTQLPAATTEPPAAAPPPGAAPAAPAAPAPAAPAAPAPVLPSVSPDTNDLQLPQIPRMAPESINPGLLGG